VGPTGTAGWRFYESKGLIWVDVGDDRAGLWEALADSVSSLAPRGEPPALSTYWIDHALRADETGLGEVITQGNSTSLVRTATGVRAEALYDTFAPEEVGLDEFLSGLRAWRHQVRSEMPRELPDQAPYQRNPHE
jgi:hypothetical protein